MVAPKCPKNSLLGWVLNPCEPRGTFESDYAFRTDEEILKMPVIELSFVLMGSPCHSGRS